MKAPAFAAKTHVPSAHLMILLSPAKPLLNRFDLFLSASPVWYGCNIDNTAQQVRQVSWFDRKCTSSAVYEESEVPPLGESTQEGNRTKITEDLRIFHVIQTVGWMPGEEEKETKPFYDGMSCHIFVGHTHTRKLCI